MAPKRLSPRIGEYFARDDAAAQWWGVSFESGGRYAEQLRFLSEQVDPAGKVVLDAATGRGRFAIHFARQGAASILAVDIAAKMIEVARANAERHGVAPRIEFRVGDLLEARFAEASFDVITLMEVLVHLPEPERVLAALARALKPGGWLAVNYDFPLAPWVTYPIDLLQRRDQRMYRTVEQTIDALEGTAAEGDARIVTRPRDAYRGLGRRYVARLLERSGLRPVAAMPEHTRCFGRRFPIAIGRMELAQRV
ncbi:MAG TPA: class I SAM-dependent methyltransferase [Candidatus Polarisedimenticolaceae bacterium]|nr:class I SAM-dependent methyltransferase [Candidatus Polarisedimenticolaceae bacterium]